MKKVGVPDTPLSSALATSRAMRGAWYAAVDVVREALEVEAQLLRVAAQVHRAAARPDG